MLIVDYCWVCTYIDIKYFINKKKNLIYYSFQLVYNYSFIWKKMYLMAYTIIKQYWPLQLLIYKFIFYLKFNNIV